RPGGYLLYVHVPAGLSRRDGAVLTGLSERDAHHAEERFERDANPRSKLRRDAVELPHLEIGLGEIVGKESAAGVERGVAEIAGDELEDLDPQRVAGPRAANGDRSGQRVALHGARPHVGGGHAAPEVAV